MKAGAKRMHFYSTLILQGKELKGQVLTSANKTSTNRSKRGKVVANAPAPGIKA